MKKQTGMTSGKKRKVGTSKEYPVIFDFDITVPYDQSHQTMLDLLGLIDSVPSSGVKLELESRIKHSLKREMERTLRVLQLSSGMATKVKNMLLSMNFEEQSVSSTFYDGQINILAWWKSKDQLRHCELQRFGSPAISPSKSGTKDLMKKLSELCEEDSIESSTSTR